MARTKKAAVQAKKARRRNTAAKDALHREQRRRLKQLLDEELELKLSIVRNIETERFRQQVVALQQRHEQELRRRLLRVKDHEAQRHQHQLSEQRRQHQLSEHQQQN